MRVPHHRLHQASQRWPRWQGAGRLGLALAVAAAALLAAALPAAPARHALAHAEYARSVPAADSTVRAAERVEVWFTQDLFRRAGANVLAVTAPDGRRVESGEAAVDTADRKRLSVPLQPGLAPGLYTVAWASLSATDGDTAEGAFRFTIDPAAPPPAPAAASASGAAPEADGTRAGPLGRTEAAGSRFPYWTGGGALLAVAALGLGWWAVQPPHPARTGRRR